MKPLQAPVLNLQLESSFVKEMKVCLATWDLPADSCLLLEQDIFYIIFPHSHHIWNILCSSSCDYLTLIPELTTVTWVSLTGTGDPDLGLEHFYDSSANGIGSCDHGDIQTESQI